MISAERIEKKQGLTIVHPVKHRHTIIWLHGLGEPHDRYIKKIYNPLGQNADNFKIILPRAPNRLVTDLGIETTSWFNIIFRGQRRFIVPFDQAFSSKQINENFQTILLPIIEQQSKEVKAVGGKLIVAGFSQGCGMSIHCLYSKPELVDAAIGASGYFFAITKYDPTLNARLHLIYGGDDSLSPWQHTKLSYYGKISSSKVNFVPGMEHSVNKDTEKAIGNAVNVILGSKPKL